MVLKVNVNYLLMTLLFLVVNDIIICTQTSGIMLDSNLSYEHHIKSILNKVNKTIGLLRKFQLILPRHSFITSYKTFIRPHLDYGDVIRPHFWWVISSMSWIRPIWCCYSNNRDNKRDIVGEAFSRTRVGNLEIKTLI